MTLESLLKSPPKQSGIPKGWVSAASLVERSGKSRHSVRVELKRLADAGLLEIQKVRTLNIVGDPVAVPVYRLKK